MPVYLHKRHYTPAEARGELSLIRVQCEELIRLKKKLVELNYDIYKHEYFGGLGPNGSKFHPRELEDLIAIVKNFDHRGVLIKSLDDGLIDFPSIRPNGEEVYLCWKVGEADLEFWHTIDGGFDGRQPLEQF